MPRVPGDTARQVNSCFLQHGIRHRCARNSEFLQRVTYSDRETRRPYRYRPLFFLLFQHSMLYFFHHYELPIILQQAQLQQLLFRNHSPPQAQPATPSTGPTTPGPGSSPSPSPSSSSPSSSTAPSPSFSLNLSASTTEQTQQNYITELSQLDLEPSNAGEQHANAEQTSATTANRRDDSVRGMSTFLSIYFPSRLISHDAKRSVLDEFFTWILLYMFNFSRVLTYRYSNYQIINLVNYL